MVMLEALSLILTILDKLGKVYDLDINIKVKRKRFKEDENGTHGTHQQNGIGFR